MNFEGWTTAIQLPLDLVLILGPVDSERDIEMNASIAGSKLDIGGQVMGNVKAYAAVACFDMPVRSHPGSISRMHSHRPITCTDLELVEASVQVQATVPTVSLEVTIEILTLNTSVPGVHAQQSAKTIELDGSVT
jgi:hypothetical protein